MNKYKTGLIVGRFQPFHKGHLFLLLKSGEICDNIIIGVGSTNKKNIDNPYNYKTRKKMLIEVIKKENLGNKVKKIIPLKDIPNDNEWLKNVLEKTGAVDIVIGNNDWVSGIFRDAGYKVVEIPFLKRNYYEGKKIRDRMRNHEEWKNRVPLYILGLIKE